MVEAWDPAYPAALERDYTGWRRALVRWAGPWHHSARPDAGGEERLVRDKAFPPVVKVLEHSSVPCVSEARELNASS